MIMEEIVKLPHVITITKTLDGLEWPKVPKKFKDLLCVYYCFYKPIGVIKVGQSVNMCERFGGYESAVNIYPKIPNNGSWRTVHKIYDLLKAGETIEIYARTYFNKKKYEIHEGKRVYLIVDLKRIEKIEKNKYRKTLLLP
tara:strand:+ start:39 stop:461 length:423 start_codon:yes stop_codon:yes gene_type:complete